MILMNADILRFPQFDGHIIIHQLIMAEVILDHLSPVSQGQDKILMTEMGVILHDMPENGTFPDIHHRFGTKFRLLTQTGTSTTAKNDHFHNSISLL